MTPSQIFEHLYDALNRHDWEAVGALMHPDYVEEYPQSGERISGISNVRELLSNYPGGAFSPVEGKFHGDADDQWVISPSYTVVHVTATGEKATGLVKARYPDGTDWWIASLFEIRDGLLYRQTSIFGPRFEAPEWRSKWVERFES